MLELDSRLVVLERVLVVVVLEYLESGPAVTADAYAKSIQRFWMDSIVGVVVARCGLELLLLVGWLEDLLQR